MTIIIPVLTGLMYLGIYEHDKAWLLNKTQTAAAELTAYEKSFDTVKWNGVIGGETVSGNVSRILLPPEKTMPFRIWSAS